MAGRFEGLSDLEWHLFADVFPPALMKRGHGMPQSPFRKVVNTLLYVLITVLDAVIVKTGRRGRSLKMGVPQW